MSAMHKENNHSAYHEIRVIKPNEAEQMLGKARSNSSIDQRLLDSYKRDMQHSAWKLNGDPIIFGNDGSLLDGRLRLKACVASGAAFETLVIHNIDPDNFLTIDSVRRRTAGDIMSIRGEKSGRALAAALTALWRAGNKDLQKQYKKQSTQELVEILGLNPTIRRSLEYTKRVTPTLPHGLATALHFLFQNENRAKADKFFDDFSRGEELSSGAAYALWRALENIRIEGGRRSPQQIIGLAFKAWQALKEDRDVKLIRFASDIENFPETPGLDGLILPDANETTVAHEIRNSSKFQGSNVHKKSISVEILQMTPVVAERLLEKNDKNRGIAAGIVNKYVRDMRNQDWALNGQTIKIGASGRLLDGQHRLSACVKSGKEFPAIIVRGLNDDVFDTFDVGNKKSIADVLKDMQESNTALLGGALRVIWQLENELVTIRTATPSINELLDVLEQHPGIRNSARLGNKVKKLGSPSQLVALHHIFALADDKKAHFFIDKLSYGDELKRGSPILALRDLLIEDRNNPKRKMSMTERLALTIKAWNAFKADKEVKSLKWANSGLKRENFPQIFGWVPIKGVNNAQAA